MKTSLKDQLADIKNSKVNTNANFYNGDYSTHSMSHFEQRTDKTIEEILNGTMGKYSNPMSYANIRRDIARFRGAIKDDRSREFEAPNTYYFKLFFYFNNIDANDDSMGSNLLGLPVDLAATKLMDYSAESNQQNINTILYSDGNYDANKYMNTAYNFLLNNSEYERAEMLRDFIYLLSDISSNTPWFFQEISGLGELLKRPGFQQPELTIEEERKQLTIKCLPDSIDNRIGTLLDLYKAVCFSYENKKEIVPANLRKFDMGIYIFSAPIRNFYSPLTNYGESAVLHSPNGDDYQVSSKYIELHDCEIDITSSAESMDTISDAEGTPIEYNIKIWVGDAFENRYNEFLLKDIGDMVKVDMVDLGYTATPETSNLTADKAIDDAIDNWKKFQGTNDDEENLEDLQKSTQNSIYQYYDSTAVENTERYYESAPNTPPSQKKSTAMAKFITDAIQAYNPITSLTNAVKSAVLGNMYGLSVKNIADSIQNFNLGSLSHLASSADKAVQTRQYDYTTKFGWNGVARTVSDISSKSKKTLGNFIGTVIPLNSKARSSASQLNKTMSGYKEATKSTTDTLQGKTLSGYKKAAKNNL